MSLNLSHCFSLCITMHPSLLKLEKRELRSILATFMKKCFQVYQNTLGKFAWNLKLTQGLTLSAFEQPALGYKL